MGTAIGVDRRTRSKNTAVIENARAYADDDFPF